MLSAAEIKEIITIVRDAFNLTIAPDFNLQAYKPILTDLVKSESEPKYVVDESRIEVPSKPEPI